MIRVVADVFEVIVFAAGTDAFLSIAGPWWIVGGLFNPEEIGHERVHPGVGEQQTGRLRKQRRRRHNRVLFFTEKIQKTLADGGGGHRHTCQTMNCAR